MVETVSSPKKYDFLEILRCPNRRFDLSSAHMWGLFVLQREFHWRTASEKEAHDREEMKSERSTLARWVKTSVQRKKRGNRFRNSEVHYHGNATILSSIQRCIQGHVDIVRAIL